MICTKCGQVNADGVKFCESCGTALDSVQTVEKQENMVTGIVGAFIGSLIGGASIILLSQLGYVASISGLILAVCTLKGYELLGGKLSTKGIIICAVIMLVMPYLADRIDWAIALMQQFPEYNFTFGEAFALIPELLRDGAITMGDYVKNLLMIYGFALLGAFSTLRNAFKK